MLIKAGFNIEFGTSAPTPMSALLNVHPSRMGDLVSPMRMVANPDLALRDYFDSFGNLATRLMLPAGATTLSAEFLITDSGEPDRPAPDTALTPVQDLPDEVLPFLLASP